MLRILCILLVLPLASVATAAPTVLRIATVAPDGSGWAREIHAFAREVERDTAGDVHVKIYFDAIAGDENEVQQRIERGQLDGAVSGGMLCARAAPSLRLFRLLDLVLDRQEAAYLINRLRPSFDHEFEAHGYVTVGIAIVGMDLVFSRWPVRSLSDLQRGRYWIWNADEVLQKQLAALGVHLVPAPLSEAGALYDTGKVDGFSTVPGAALAFQWSTRAKWATPLAFTVLPGCVMVTQRAFDALPFEARQAVRNAGAKLEARVNDLTASQDETLLGALFARQGLAVEPPSPRLRTEFSAAAVDARRRLGSEFVPPALQTRAIQLLTEYRSHR